MNKWNAVTFILLINTFYLSHKIISASTIESFSHLLNENYQKTDPLNSITPWDNAVNYALIELKKNMLFNSPYFLKSVINTCNQILYDKPSHSEPYHSKQAIVLFPLNSIELDHNFLLSIFQQEATIKTNDQKQRDALLFIAQQMNAEFDFRDILRSVDEQYWRPILEKYAYVHVGTPPSDFNKKMNELCERIVNQYKDATVDKITLAADAMFDLVTIHPFKNGNGRTSRLLGNLILVSAGYTPFIITSPDEYNRYNSLINTIQKGILTKKSFEDYVRSKVKPANSSVNS